MSQNGHEPESFPDKTSFTSMFNAFADCIKECVWTTRKNWPSYSKIQIWLLVFPWSKHASNKYIDIKDKKPIHTKWHFDEFDVAWPLWWEKGVNKTTSTKRRPSAEKFTSPHCWLFATWNIQNRRNCATIWRQNSLAKRYRQRRYWWLRGFHRTKSINVSHSSR